MPVSTLIILLLMPVALLSFLVGVLYLLVGEEPMETGGPPPGETVKSASSAEWWDQIAVVLELDHVHDYPAEPPRLEGEIEGERVVVRRAWQRAGTPEPVVEVDLDDAWIPDGFGMVSQNAPDVVDRIVDREDIVVGHDELDSAFVFHGLNEREVKQFVWTEGVEEHLQAIRRLPPSAHIADGKLHSGLTGSLPGTRPNVDRAARQIRKIAKWVAGLRAIVEGRDGESREREQADEQ